MAEKVLAFCIAMILVVGKMRLEIQMKKDRKNGLDVDSEEYRYGRIVGNYIEDLMGRFRKRNDIKDNSDELFPPHKQRDFVALKDTIR